MTQEPDIRVLPVHGSHRAALLRLKVHESQLPFVGFIADLLADAESCPSSEPMTILCDDEPIGFYRIETQARCIAGTDFPRPTLGLRSFFIDHRWQGQGLGGRALAAIVKDLVDRHPAARNLALTVNVRNTPAIALYRRAGFADTGELYHGGPSGPQHLMVRALPA